MLLERLESILISKTQVKSGVIGVEVKVESHQMCDPGQEAPVHTAGTTLGLGIGGKMI